MNTSMRRLIMLVESADWNQRYVLFDPAGNDQSPPPDSDLRAIFKSLQVEHFGVLLAKGWVLGSIDHRVQPPVRLHVGTGAPEIAIQRCLSALGAFGVSSTQPVALIASDATRTVPLADVLTIIAQATAPERKVVQRFSKAQKAADQQGSAMEIDTANNVFERVVWDDHGERPKLLHTNALSEVGFQDVAGVYAVHVGDPEFWFNKLVHDYDRDADAWVIEIKGRAGDALVEDVQYAIPDESGSKGDSGILFTSRATLTEGRDFRYTRHLTADDLDDEDHTDNESFI